MHELISEQDFYGDTKMHFIASQAVYDYVESYDDHLSLQEGMHHPIDFHAKMMDCIMHLHQAWQQPNAPQFVQTMICEINGHIKNDYWRLMKQEKVSRGCKDPPSVSTMRRKHNLITNEIKSHTAR